MDEKIVVPLDGSKVGEAALSYVEGMVTRLSPEVKTEVILLQVISREHIPTVGGYAPLPTPHGEEQLKETEKKAMDYLNKTGKALRTKGVTVTTRVTVGDASEQIVKIAEEINANLIAMSTHGRSGLSRWAFGSVTDKVLRREGRIPIVMVRAPR